MEFSCFDYGVNRYSRQVSHAQRDSLCALHILYTDFYE